MPILNRNAHTLIRISPSTTMRKLRLDRKFDLDNYIVSLTFIGSSIVSLTSNLDRKFDLDTNDLSYIVKRNKGCMRNQVLPNPYYHSVIHWHWLCGLAALWRYMPTWVEFYRTYMYCVSICYENRKLIMIAKIIDPTRTIPCPSTTHICIECISFKHKKCGQM